MLKNNGYYEIIKIDRFKTKSAGLYNQKPVTQKQIELADDIIVMEDHQRTKIAKRFPKLYMQKRILFLNIPDIYHYDQTELRSILNPKVKSLSIH